MTGRDKLLYHQIHPLKLFTDWSAGLISFYLLWQRRPRAAFVAQFLPAIIVSGALMRWADLTAQRESPFGRYVKRHMPPAMQTVRMVGNMVVSVGAWYRRPEIIVVGMATILFGWLRGWLVSHVGR